MHNGDCLFCRFVPVGKQARFANVVPAKDCIFKLQVLEGHGTYYDSTDSGSACAVAVFYCNIAVISRASVDWDEASGYPGESRAEVGKVGIQSNSCSGRRTGSGKGSGEYSEGTGIVCRQPQKFF